MSHKLPAGGFEWVKELSKFDERFIKNYNENSNEEYFLEVDVEIPKNLFSLHKDLSYLLERKKLEKVKKLVCGIEDREKYVVHIITLKQALNHGLKLKKVHRVIPLRSMHESMYWNEHWINKNSKKWFWKRFL